MNQLLKIKETCEYLGISRRQLNYLVETKQLPYINLGLGKEIPRFAFSREALDKFINSTN